MNAIRDRLNALRQAWYAAAATYHLAMHRIKRRRELPDYF